MLCLKSNRMFFLFRGFIIGMREVFLLVNERRAGSILFNNSGSHINNKYINIL